MMKHLKFLMIALGKEGNKRSILTPIVIISIFLFSGITSASVPPTPSNFTAVLLTSNNTVQMSWDTVGTGYEYPLYVDGVYYERSLCCNVNYPISAGSTHTFAISSYDTSASIEGSQTTPITISSTSTPVPSSTPIPSTSPAPTGTGSIYIPTNAVYTDLGNGSVHIAWDNAPSGSDVSYYDIYVDGIKQNTAPITQSNVYDFSLTNPDSHTITMNSVTSTGISSSSVNVMKYGSTPVPTDTSTPTPSSTPEPTPVPTLCPNCVMFTQQEICDICTCINNLQPTLNSINDSTNGVITQLVNLGNQLSAKIDQQIASTDQVRLGIDDLKNQLLGQLTPTQNYPLPTIRPLPQLSDNQPPMVNGVFTDNTTYFTDQGDAASPTWFPMAPEPRAYWDDTKGGFKYRQNPLATEPPKIRSPVITKTIPDIKTPTLTKSIPLTRSVPLTKSSNPIAFPKMVRQPTPPPMPIISGNQLRWNSNQYP